jgi:DNA-binding transcriptional ArsR family regulator
MEAKVMKEAYNRFLRVLCNRTRFSIVLSLRGGSKNVGSLAKELKIHQTSVSHSLNLLLECGFVKVAKNGRERDYSLNNKTIRPLIRLMESHVKSYPCSGEGKK